MNTAIGPNLFSTMLYIQYVYWNYTKSIKQFARLWIVEKSYHINPRQVKKNLFNTPK